MAEVFRTEIAGEPMHLLADRAVYWPARRRLIIADLHLGKGDVFRAAGIPIPSGGTAHDLQRLGALLRDSGAGSLWILGDFLHGPRNRSVDAAWLAFRAAHAGIDMVVIRGNHDRALDAAAAGLRDIAGGVREGPFVFDHAPGGVHAGHLVAGHLHPVARLPGAGTHPLFWLRPRSLVLPAFSRFTGGHRVLPGQYGGSVICDGRQVFQLPA